MTFQSPHIGAAWRGLLAAALCGLLTTPALADDAERLKALEGKLDESLRLIQALSARLAELERGQPKPATATAAGASATAVAQSAEIARLQESVAQLSDSVAKRSGDTGLPVHGFVDTGAGWSSGSDPQRLRGFSAGTLDLYLTPQFSERVKSLIEIVLEYNSESALGIDTERIQLGYTLTDSLTIWAGRFHTPFGLWNTSFHHGANLQTSIYRPRFIDFEDKGGIIPAHSVGVWGSGKLRLGGSKLSYDAFVANGPSIRGRVLDFNPFTDDSSGKMVGLNVGWQPGGAAAGLTVGLHGFSTQVQVLDGAGAQLSSNRVRMGGAYFGYDADDWEALGEYYAFRNTEQSGGLRHSSKAWFVQVGKTFDAFTPFVRHERAALDSTDPYFISQESGRPYQRTAAGVRYALDARSSLKLELSRTRESSLNLLDDSGAPTAFNGGSYRRASVQFSAAF